MKLSELKDKDKGIIVKIQGYGAFRKRITEMGFIKGKQVSVIKNAPLRDPVEYEIMGYKISLRRSEAELIEVVKTDKIGNIESKNFNGTISNNKKKSHNTSTGKNIQIALVGNPNSGKTTLFNYASGSKEHVGNYSGVTVDSKKAIFYQDSYKFNINDLPGTYSLTAYSPEELYVRNFIIDQKPDIVINVIDASNIERNLYLTTQLIDMDIKVIIALNMYDELENKNIIFDYEKLGNMIGIPIIPTVSSKGKGIKDLFNKAIDVYENLDPSVRHIHINYGSDIEKSIHKISNLLKNQNDLNTKLSPRFLSIKLLENDSSAQKYIISKEKIHKLVKDEISKIESNYQEVCETVITDARYGFIDGALKETYTDSPLKTRQKTEIIDNFVTHKLFGFPIFFMFIFLTFYATFNLGEYPMQIIEQLVALLSSSISSIMSNGPLKDLIVDGIIGGVGGVIVFLPNILILFLFISFMEDTGYMARAAFIMDKLMHKLGLHGKSFIPMIMGFGCNVPALMSTRTLENKNDRILTMLIIPFMSCSARLPVYILLIGTFFPNNSSLILFSIYLTGILLAVIFAKIFKLSFFKSKEAPFVMELPPYRMPTIKTTLRHMWSKGVQYLKKMGGVILIASILIWALGYFPREVEFSQDYDVMIHNTETNFSKQIINKNVTEIEALTYTKDSIIANYTNQMLEEKQEKSYIGQLGHFASPIFSPLGFDWKMTVSIITGITAKEVVVSTMGVLYQEGGDTDENSGGLREKLRNQKFTSGDKIGQKVFTSASALAFLLFILIYFPCVAVIVAIAKEANWKWAIFVAIYTTILAWLLALVVNQLGNLII